MKRNVKGVIMSNSNMVKIKYVIYDMYIDEYLLKYPDEEWGSGVGLQFDSSAIFDSKSDAEVVVSLLEKSFREFASPDEIKFSIKKHYQGQGLYEEIRKALVSEYGRTLCEYNTDHDLTKAVVNVLKEKGLV